MLLTRNPNHSNVLIDVKKERENRLKKETNSFILFVPTEKTRANTHYKFYLI